MNKGWICPRCETAHSPSVTQCDCKPLADAVSPMRWPHGYHPPLTPTFVPYQPPIAPPCNCKGACGNVACPHMPKITCGLGLPSQGSFAVLGRGGT